MYHTKYHILYSQCFCGVLGPHGKARASVGFGAVWTKSASALLLKDPFVHMGVSKQRGPSDIPTSSI